ncbi:MAG: carboxypeptidase-like regulatory domain-containing protein [Gammaproteobacteria bacterium]|jgi:hypothetical protein
MLVFGGVRAAGEQQASEPIPPGTGDYVDQLIDPALAAELERGEPAEDGGVPQGRRFFSIEYQHYQERQDPYDLTENGVLVNWGQETLDYGEFRLEALGRTGDSDQPFADTSGSGHFILNQYGFVIDENRIMDNTLGVLRSASDPMISRSFRLNLSSTLLAGGQSRVTHDGVSVLYASAGRIGRLDTGQIQAFDIEEGEQYSLGYSRQLNRRLRAGAHLVHVDGSDNTTDHQSLASAVQYLSADGAGLYTGHALVDSEAQYGLWADGDNRIGRWRHRYGLFRLEPELLWSDNEPNNDQQGGYLRSEMTTLRYDVAFGLDLTQTDIDNRDERAGNNLYNGFVNGSWRRSRKTTVGGTLTLRGSDPRDDFSRDDTRAYQLSGFVAHGFQIGVSRLQLLASRLQEGGKTGNGYGLIWDQDWDVDRDLTFSSTLAHETERGLDNSESSSWAALLFRHAVTSRLHWNGDLSYTHVDRDNGKTQNTTNASLAVVWRFLPKWDASLRATYNRVGDALETAAVDFSDETKTLLLNIRYSDSSGRPFTVLGEPTDAAGHGVVTGVVFYDENGDGRRQAGEQPAAGVFIYLDRRYQAVTDHDGRYVFAPVPTGRHDVTLAQEDLPLPWGLLDEAPRAVEVDVRAKAVQDFALQRLNE